LLRRAKLLPIALLTKCSQLLTSLLNCGTICLSRTKPNALLLLGGLKRLLITLLIKRGYNLTGSKRLLTTQCLTLQSRAITPESSRANSFSLLLRLLLTKLLP
jgi:hypothetical protein